MFARWRGSKYETQKNTGKKGYSNTTQERAEKRCMHNTQYTNYKLSDSVRKNENSKIKFNLFAL